MKFVQEMSNSSYCLDVHLDHFIMEHQASKQVTRVFNFFNVTLGLNQWYIKKGE